MKNIGQKFITGILVGTLTFGLFGCKDKDESKEEPSYNSKTRIVEGIVLGESFDQHSIVEGVDAYYFSFKSPDNMLNFITVTEGAHQANSVIDKGDTVKLAMPWYFGRDYTISFDDIVEVRGKYDR